MCSHGQHVNGRASPRLANGSHRKAGVHIFKPEFNICMMFIEASIPVDLNYSTSIALLEDSF